MDPFNILALGGSLRRPSSTSGALALACEGAVSQGAAVTSLDGSLLPAQPFDPLTAYSQPPPSASALVAASARADGFLWASPAYHGTVSGLFKNALDYLDLLRNAEPPFLSGKPVGIISVGSGTIAVVNAANTMVYAAHALRAQPLPMLVPIGNADACFDGEGRCQDLGVAQRLRVLGAAVVRAVAAARNQP